MISRPSATDIFPGQKHKRIQASCRSIFMQLVQTTYIVLPFLPSGAVEVLVLLSATREMI